ncbi:MAG: molybdopterin-synthase adenylyltransferase MoeB [Limimaricola sp.]|uniref:HesA/MoeB/ThiF family protein n=1 Tax=Limimaricola sp. TaxID=2211665 RepID=UPI001DC7892E|nr:molybdopterin-synthase adenylyltransferase MoeB [Limimaricola sp.]MBI1417743.1 molybdopterin-synthase adenylyltransferase MoeB [Limimaricola sp.]
MILVGVMAAAIWGLGMLTGAPTRARWTMLAVLLGAVMLEQVLLPAGHPLREATGHDVRFWLLLVGFAAVVWAYRAGLGTLRNRARVPDAVPEQGGFSEPELERYARHIMLREVGGPGQARLKGARVLVVGAGGLGSPALLYLAGAGVGTIGVIDDDTVDASNLQRQVIHGEDRLGLPKVQSAVQALAALNRHVTLRPYNRRLTDEIAADLIDDYDLVLDGSDNFATRYLLNAACAKAGKPLVAAAITQWEGQISVYDPAHGTPCYQCVFPEAPAAGLVPTCAEAGVIGPLPGVLGAMMALEAIKVITGAGETLAGRLLIYDALDADTRVMRLKRRPDCPICGAAA